MPNHKSLPVAPTIADPLVVEQFECVSVILPVINETTSLKQTVDIVRRDVEVTLVKEFLIVVCQRTTPESMTMIAQLQNELGDLVVVVHQQMPYLGGALAMLLRWREAAMSSSWAATWKPTRMMSVS